DTIDGLLGRLEVALDAHKRFVANAAHELRTPLTVEHALLEEPLIDPDADAAAFRANFERLLVVSDQRARLLESLLTLSGSEHVNRLFEPFQRLHRTADDGHHGLGLSIVRAIAVAHGATLTARPRIAGGLVVEVTFDSAP